MKRFTLLLLVMAFFGLTQPSMAQDDAVVIIPEGASFNGTSYLPASSSFNYSLSQQIYTATEIGMSGLIKSIGFFNQGYERSRTIDIYMFETTEDWMTSSGLAMPALCQCVFRGSVYFKNGSWTEIELDTPFEYDGVSNLCLVVDGNTGIYSSGLGCQIFYPSKTQAVYKSSNTDNFDPYTYSSFYTVNCKNRLMLVVGENPYPKPKNLQVTEMTDNGATLSWTNPGGSNVTGWEMQYRLAGTDSWTNVSGTVSNPFTLGNLTLNANYDIRLRALYGSVESSWTYFSFTYQVFFDITLPSELSSYLEAPASAASGTEVTLKFKFNNNSTQTQGLRTLTITPDNGGDAISITHNFPIQQSAFSGSAFNYVFTMPHDDVTLAGTIVQYYSAQFMYCYGPYTNGSGNIQTTRYTFLPVGMPTTLTPNAVGLTGCTFVDYQIFNRTSVWGNYVYTEITDEILNGNVLTMPGCFIVVVEHYSVDDTTHTLTVDDASGYVTSITPSDAQVNYGAKVRYTLATMPDNYIAILSDEYGEIVKTTLVDGDNPYYYFYMPDEDLTLSVRPANSYHITYREVDYNRNILSEDTYAMGYEYTEIEVPFADHGIWEYSGYNTMISALSGADSFDGTTFIMPPCDVIIEGEFHPVEDVSVLLLMVNNRPYSVIPFEYGQANPIPLPALETPVNGIPAEFTFVGWTTIWETGGYFDPEEMPYNMEYGYYYNTYNDYHVLHALFGQQGDGDAQYPFSTAQPQDGDQLIIAQYQYENGNDIFKGLDQQFQAVELDAEFYNGNPYINASWDDLTADDFVWDFESVSVNRIDGFAIKRGRQYLNIVGPDGNGDYALALAVNYQHGVFDFSFNTDMPFFSIQELTTGKYLNVDSSTDTFVAGDDAEFFPLFKKQSALSNYTTAVRTYGEGETIDMLAGITYITGRVTASSWLNNNGLVFIEPNGFLECSGGFDNYYPERLVIKDGGQLYYRRSNPVATMLKHVAAYDDATAGTDWRFIASPITYEPLGYYDYDEDYNVSNVETESAYDLFRFNEGTSVTGEGNKYLVWENAKAHTEQLDPDNPFVKLFIGQGYLYANAADVDLEFVGELAQGDELSVELNRQGTHSLAGWNLVGNPFSCNASLGDKPYYVCTGASIVTGSGAIPPLTGVMVKASTDGEIITFTKVDPQQQPDRARQLVIEVDSANGAQLMDNARVDFGGSQLEKFFYNENSCLYIPHDDKDFAVVSTDSEGSLPLCFKAKEDGQYTITVNAENVDATYLHLVDSLTGTDADLLANGSYTFSATTTDPASRFKLVFRTK